MLAFIEISALWLLGVFVFTILCFLILYIRRYSQPCPHENLICQECHQEHHNSHNECKYCKCQQCEYLKYHRVWLVSMVFPMFISLMYFCMGMQIFLITNLEDKLEVINSGIIFFGFLGFLIFFILFCVELCEGARSRTITGIIYFIFYIISIVIYIMLSVYANDFEIIFWGTTLIINSIFIIIVLIKLTYKMQLMMKEVSIFESLPNNV